MKFTKSKVEKCLFVFGNEDEVKIENQIYQIGGAHATFIVDSDSYTLSIESDWGSYSHKWWADPNEEFKKLLCRIGTDYLLRKISDKTEINWKETKKRAKEAYFRYGAEKDKERVSEFLRELNHVDNNEVRFYDFMCDHNEALFEGSYFVKEYPIQAQITALIFKKYLLPELQKELLGVLV